MWLNTVRFFYFYCQKNLKGKKKKAKIIKFDIPGELCNVNNLVNPYYKHRNGAVGGEKETDCRMSTTKNNKNEQHKSFGNKGPLNSLSPSFTPFLYSGGQNRKCPSTLTSSGCQHALKNSQGSFITLFRLHKMQLITLNLSCALIWIAV